MFKNATFNDIPFISRRYNIHCTKSFVSWSSEPYLKYIYAKFMLNEIGVQSVSWSDVSIANKKMNRAGMASFQK
jgi:hypothetical protein